MVKVKSLVTIHPERSAKASATLHIEHQDSPKSARAKEAVKAVTKWARHLPIYRGRDVVVEAHTLIIDGEDGEGKVNVDGATVSRFSVVRELPEPVPAESLFGGGL